MLVIDVNENWTWQKLYFGNFDAIKIEARFLARNNKHVIAIPKFKNQSLV